jgi:antirestriction protein ArdC/phage/plasmid primase-like uncharacterized protein
MTPIKKPFHEQVAETLIAQLKAGTAPWQKPWQAGEAGTRLPHNPTTGKRYSGINAIHLMSQGYADQRWMTYKQAATASAQVRQGEKGTAIQYWKFDEEQQVRGADGKTVRDAQGKPVTEPVRLERPRVFFATVFNAEQIDGLPAPAARKVQGWSAVERAEKILRSSGAVIHHGEHDRAFYRFATDSIHLPDKAQFPSADAYYATALHELGHWTGHASRLGRDLVHPFGSEGYAREELRAEIASMILGDELGIGHDPGQHAAYVGSWIRVLQQDPLEVFRAAADAEKIERFVLNHELSLSQSRELSGAVAVPAHTEVVNDLFNELEIGMNAQHDAATMVPVAETWTLTQLGQGTLFRALANANEEQLVRVQSALHDMAPLDSTNPFWQRHHLSERNDALAKEIDPAIDFVEERVAEMRIGKARRMGTGETWVASHLEQMEIDALGFALPRAWTGRVSVQASAYEQKTGSAELFVVDAQALGVEPGFWIVYAEQESGERVWLADMPARHDADKLVERLALISAHANPNEFERAAKLARINEDRIRRDPGSTDEDISLAKEVRKHAELTAIQNDADLQRRIAEIERRTLAPVAGINPPGRDTDGIGGDAQRVADFVAANHNLRFEKMAENARNAPPELKSILADQARMHAISGQVKKTLEGVNPVYVEEAQSLIVSIVRKESDLKLVADFVAANHNLLPEEIAKRAKYAAPVLKAVLSDAARWQAVSGDLDDVLSGINSTAVRECVAVIATTLERSDAAQLAQAASESRAALNEAIAAYKRNPDQENIDARRVADFIAANHNLWQGKVRQNILEAPEDLKTILADQVKMQAIDRQVNEILSGIHPAYIKEVHAVIATTLGRSDALEREAQARKARAGLMQPVTKTFISVPFKEKDDAKALGAKWDRQAQLWYVPAGVDAAPFSKWPGKAAAAAADTTQPPQDMEIDARVAASVQARQYLAVPYSERKAAMAAGAVWDKAAKSWYAGPQADMAIMQRWQPGQVRSEQAPAMTPHEEFAEALRALRCVVSGEHPIMDGSKHRISVEGEKHSEHAGSGFYVAHLDGHPAGYIKNNKTGIELTWKSKGYVLAPAQKALMQSDAAARLRERDAVQAKLHEQAARRIKRQMGKLVPVAQATPYMQAKGIGPLPGVFTDGRGNKTYVPAVDVDGKQWSMQYIGEDGTKRFAKDSRKERCFHVVGGFDALAKAPALVIGVGYATASTLAASLGFATVAAFDSGNLPLVAKALHERYPDKPVIIAGDDDEHLELTQGVNPGKAKAQEAAFATGGVLLLPIFAPGEKALHPKGFTDFNDLATKSALGVDGIDRQVRSVVSSVIEKHQQNVEKKEQTQHLERQPHRVARIG